MSDTEAGPCAMSGVHELGWCVWVDTWMGVKAREDERPEVAPLLPYAFFAYFFATFADSFCF